MTTPFTAFLSPDPCGMVSEKPLFIFSPLKNTRKCQLRQRRDHAHLTKAEGHGDTPDTKRTVKVGPPLGHLDGHNPLSGGEEWTKEQGLHC